MGCNEYFLKEIVRIDLIPCSDCYVYVPWNVPGLIDITCPSVGDSVLALGLSCDDLTAKVEEPPTLRAVPSRQAFGTKYEHELSAQVKDNILCVRAAAKELEGVDFNMIVTTLDGTHYLCYAMPNTCQITIDEQKGRTSTLTLKAKLASMSGFIKILE